MQDLAWDIETQDLKTTGSGTTLDFVLTTNPSVQNGGILLEGQGMNITAPNYGIGVTNILNGSVANGAFQMNRWKAQAFADGATLATWRYIPALDKYAWKISYLTPGTN